MAELLERHLALDEVPHTQLALGHQLEHRWHVRRIQPVRAEDLNLAVGDARHRHNGGLVTDRQPGLHHAPAAAHAPHGRLACRPEARRVERHICSDAISQLEGQSRSIKGIRAIKGDRTCSEDRSSK